MSARDLATLARILITDYPEYYGIFAEKEFTFSGIRQHAATRCCYGDIGVDGLKTGHTEEAGYGLTASAVRDGRRLVMVLAGLETTGGPGARGRAAAGVRLPPVPATISCSQAAQPVRPGGRLARRAAGTVPLVIQEDVVGLPDARGAPQARGQGRLRRANSGSGRGWQPGGGTRDHRARPRAAPVSPGRRRRRCRPQACSHRMTNALGYLIWGSS